MIRFQNVEATLRSVLYLLECTSLIVALLSLKKLGKKHRMLALFPVVVVLSEIGGYWFRQSLPQPQSTEATNIWFNIMIPLQFSTIFIIFLKQTNFHYWKWFIRGFTATIIFIGILQFLIETAFRFNTFNYTLGAAFVSACGLHYLFELMNSNEIEEVTRDPFAYFSFGIILFYLGTLPFNSMRSYLFTWHEGVFYFYYSLFFAFNFIFYILISLGILCMKKK